jgi:hypothetical protein
MYSAQPAQQPQLGAEWTSTSAAWTPAETVDASSFELESEEQAAAAPAMSRRPAESTNARPSDGRVRPWVAGDVLSFDVVIVGIGLLV